MINLERTNVMNLENAIRGARNPMNSWGRSDSSYCCENDDIDCDICELKSKCETMSDGNFFLGKNDLDLAKRLCKSGSDHRKFLRQIFVSVDITAPLYFWKEFDQYKVGTTTNSCSTMHKIHAKEFELNDFSHDKLKDTNNGFIKNSKNELWCSGLTALETLIGTLNAYRDLFNETKEKQYWYCMIQLLPSSYNQLRTCTMTYENLFNMINARENHKLAEWNVFCEWALNLPYMKEFMEK